MLLIKKRLGTVSFLYGKQYTSIKSFILIVDKKEKKLHMNFAYEYTKQRRTNYAEKILTILN